jgi:hypothetical protein
MEDSKRDAVFGGFDAKAHSFDVVSGDPIRSREEVDHKVPSPLLRRDETCARCRIVGCREARTAAKCVCGGLNLASTAAEVDV